MQRHHKHYMNRIWNTSQHVKTTWKLPRILSVKGFLLTSEFSGHDSNFSVFCMNQWITNCISEVSEVLHIWLSFSLGRVNFKDRTSGSINHLNTLRAGKNLVNVTSSNIWTTIFFFCSRNVTQKADQDCARVTATMTLDLFWSLCFSMLGWRHIYQLSITFKKSN